MDESDKAKTYQINYNFLRLEFIISVFIEISMW